MLRGGSANTHNQHIHTKDHADKKQSHTRLVSRDGGNGNYVVATLRGRVAVQHGLNGRVVIFGCRCGEVVGPEKGRSDFMSGWRTGISWCDVSGLWTIALCSVGCGWLGLVRRCGSRASGDMSERQPQKVVSVDCVGHDAVELFDWRVAASRVSSVTSVALLSCG